MAVSVQNFRRWLDELAVGSVRCGNPLVRDFDGNKTGRILPSNEAA